MGGLVVFKRDTVPKEPVRVSCNVVRLGLPTHRRSKYARLHFPFPFPAVLSLDITSFLFFGEKK